MIIKKLFTKLCIPLMLINNNVYTFISGIILSLSTGIFTTLCFEKASFSVSWHLYISSIIYTVSGALLLYIASRVTPYQNYILAKQIIDRKAQSEIIQDFEAHRGLSWTLMLGGMIITLILGTIFLFLNYKTK